MVKYISRQAKKFASLLWRGCTLQVFYSRLVSAVVSWWGNRVTMVFWQKLRVF